MIIGDHLVEKTCSKCGFVGDEALFIKGRNTCKKCLSEYDKKRYKENTEKILKSNKKWRKENPEKIKENGKKYYKEHSEKIKENGKKRRAANPEYDKEHGKKYYKDNLEKEIERHRKWREENPGYAKRYRQSSNGRKSHYKSRAKRRNLGHKPINTWFRGSEAHHLRYSKNSNEQDNDITLYVPKELHKSIWHNGNTGQGMREINIACLEWYLNNTPEEERHPKAVKLYWNYCTLPAPDWINGDEENGFI